MDNQWNGKIRMVTAASLFDGHDAAINIVRRILQSKGVEVIHLGHNRSAHEIVESAIEEDVQGIAISSYQGGHLEFFKYIKDLLRESGYDHIKIFGGGGGTILPKEAEQLQQYGICRIYGPDDGRQMGLTGMIEEVVHQCRFPLNDQPEGWNGLPPLNEAIDIRRVARAITLAEQGLDFQWLLQQIKGNTQKQIPVIGITGTGGAGKSSVTDEIVRRYLSAFPTQTVAVISVDPSKKKTGGALLGDRIRMNAISGPRAYMRSLATREDNAVISKVAKEAIAICKTAGYDAIILETAGTGQSDISIVDYCDISIYVMTPEYGAASQLEKINMLDYADLIVINKFDKPGAGDALNDVRKQYKRNHLMFSSPNDELLPVMGICANTFNDQRVNAFFERLLHTIKAKTGISWESHQGIGLNTNPGRPDAALIPPRRTHYLSEISDSIRSYNNQVKEQGELATQLYQIEGTLTLLNNDIKDNSTTAETKVLHNKLRSIRERLNPEVNKLLEGWKSLQQKYESDYLEYVVRGNLIHQEMNTLSLSGLKIPKVVLPPYRDWGDLIRWQMQENVPGTFPFTAGVFELKRQGEDPTRMFAGEGSPERTNKRFHYLSEGLSAKRLSTAFDSVTLYGEDPAKRPDIYGKIGNAGVSIATIDDAKKLYSGFDLCHPSTSVSMTINGPAPIILAFFLNAAIDQQCEKWIGQNGSWDEIEKIKQKKYLRNPLPRYYNAQQPGRLPDHHSGLGLRLLGLSGDEALPADVYQRLKAETLQQVRGTVQADILKEDQAQNTCIFSTEFSLKLMGDVQSYFIENQIRNFYSVSISGYHIAEAGANPVTQLAFTLANGFTYVEYYLSRGMHIDDFAPNFSFFFSNGMDPEYSVIGRVARRIWAKAIRDVYQGNERSQKLKYHIQTSGRSLHAQEIDFNDIRTTLQALYAIYDNCNSLHTNAYDEAITTPTEESVRRALAIQMIINRELGTAKMENFIQGSFALEALTDLVEETVLAEFDRISSRGGVPGAMERMYQRNKIQEESLYYEDLKHSGKLPVIGVNTFLNKEGSPTLTPPEVIRSTDDEKMQQIENTLSFQRRNTLIGEQKLQTLKNAAKSNENVFEVLMDTVKYCSLGQITHALFEVGGQYRRNM